MGQKIIQLLNGWVITLTCAFVFLQTLFFQQIYPEGKLFFKSADPYWLIKMGEWIIQNTGIPFVNVLGHPFIQLEQINWVCYQWLFAVVIASINIISGINGLVLFFSFINAIVMLLIGYSLHKRNFRHFPEIGFSLLPVTSLLLINTDFRPAVFSVIFCCILNLIFSYQNFSTKRYYWFILPLLYTLWANIHIGFVFGILWLLVESVYSAIKGKSVKPFVLFVLCFGFTSINPRGFSLYNYLYTLANSSYMNENILELGHYNFASDYSLSLIILLGVVSFIFTMKSDKIRLPERILFIISLIMAVNSVRHLSYLLVFLPIFFSSAIQKFLEQNSISLSYIKKGKFNVVAYFLPLLLSGLILYSFKLYPVPKLPVHINAGFMQYLSNNHIHKPILASGDAGSELLYFTKTRSLLDTRFDMYGDDHVKKYTEIYTLKENWLQNIEKLDIKYVLYDKKIGSENFSYLEKIFKQQNWKVLYKDKDLLFISKI